MSEKSKMPEWFENWPPYKPGKKKPIKITKEMEKETTYGMDGHDSINHFIVKTDKITSSDYAMSPGSFSITPGKHIREEVYYVVKGEAIVINPENGESVRIKEGNASITPKGTLHQVFNFGEEELFVLLFTHKEWDEKTYAELEEMVKSKK